MRHACLRSAFIPLALAALLAAAVPPAFAAADAPAGSVKAITGEAKVARDGAAPTALKAGDKIYEKDVLTTSAAASLGLVLRDNSTLSLGPSSRLVVERFLFAPEKGALASLIRIKKGSMAYTTGEMAKLSPETMQFMAAGYTIGIRGTHILVNVDEEPENTEGR